MIVFALAAFSTTFAQENVNEKQETTVTKTTVKNSKGVDVSTKAVTNTEKQSIAIEGQVDRNNFSTTITPTIANTEVSYNNEGKSYMFENEDNGYKIVSLTGTDKNDHAIVRPSSRDGYYILSQNGESSFGYFDTEGNFVVESYNADTDDITSTIYKIEMKEKKIMKKSKL
ncbi:hypothetical protein GCM10008083_14700 [Ulvibacter litoralis]|nr:hypothetical protein GCM10008083_14700 [Ulvibacter litoralis]